MNYISLGYHEKDDVGVIIDFIETLPGVGNIGIWGRSMGAATTMLYAHKDPRVKAICVDSPFADFKKLAKELTLRYANIPNFILETILSFIRSTIKKKNGMDINLLKPIEAAKKTFQPVLFIHAKNDELIGYQHSNDLFEVYKGPKFIKLLDEGGHNSRRPPKIIKQIGDFFRKYLNIDNLELLLEEKDTIFEFEEKEGIEDNKINSINKEEGDMNTMQKNIIASQDKHIKNIEQNEKEHIEHMKSCLLKINPKEIKSNG